MDAEPDDIDCGLVDLTDVPLDELMTSEDPALRASLDRITSRVLTERADDGHC